MRHLKRTLLVLCNLKLRHIYFYLLIYIKKRFFIVFYYLSNKQKAPNLFIRVKDPLKKARNKDKWINSDFAFFLNEKKRLYPKWNPNNTSMLWKYHLHSFEYLNTISALEEGLNLMRDWIRNHTPSYMISWHPYNLSLRICNWIWFLSEYSNIKNQNFLDVRNSLYKQTYFLAMHLEREKEGNHLIENCKALIVSGSFFKNKIWIKQGYTVLKKELSRQIYREGTHYEKSVMYHSIVLECLFTIFITLKENKSYKEFNKIVLSYIQKMAQYFSDVLINNQIPLQHDSYRNFSCDSMTLLSIIKNYVEINSSHQIEKLYSKIGNYIYKNENIYVLYDVGSPHPHFRPGHAHNSTFHFDLYLDKEPILCDSGVYEYENSPFRYLFRSTRSHNTVQINNKELNEIWGSFRMIKNGKVIDVTKNKKEILATHDFFKKSEKSTVQRKFKILDNDNGIEVEDVIQSKKDSLVIKDYLNFSKDIKIIDTKKIGNSLVYRLQSKKNIISLKIFNQNEIKVKITSSFFSKEFKRINKRLKLTISSKSNAKITKINYMIKKEM